MYAIGQNHEGPALVLGMDWPSPARGVYPAHALDGEPALEAVMISPMCVAHAVGLDHGVRSA